jgi:hypothetical protein
MNGYNFALGTFLFKNPILLVTRMPMMETTAQFINNYWKKNLTVESDSGNNCNPQLFIKVIK